jgi:two-component system chemotaxis response regulator CheB
MNNRIRVMICDDSSVLRSLIAKTLEEDETIEVVYSAHHGQDALANLDSHQPEVVVLDLEMPVMDGIETTEAIRKIDAKLPIIMFSSLTSHGARATFEALQAGASDFAAKPRGIGHLAEAANTIRRDLIPKIQSQAKSRANPNASKSPDTLECSSPKSSNMPIRAIGIGVSTGGPRALESILARLPADFRVPIFIVQHMPKAFTGPLAERLNSICHLNVREATDGASISPGDVWIAPGDSHMTIGRFEKAKRLELNQSAKENSVRPSVDPLFRSLARRYGRSAMGVVLTGMGKDGLEGTQSLREMGCQVLAQDQASSAVWGMPRSVIEAGLATKIVSLNEVPFEFARAADLTSLVAKSG